MYKVGIGFDAHKFVAGRPLILGGVTLDYKVGLEGHSDADVLCHAIIDSVAGICLQKDIGMLFPESDKKYENAYSLDLLAKTANMVNFAGCRICSVDSVIIAQEPKMLGYNKAMRENIARTLSLDIDAVSIKATTTEYMGFTGRSEGIACVSVSAVAPLKRI